MENPRLHETFQARDTFWFSIGQLDPDILVPLINPTFAGGPKWPSLRQAYRKVILNNKSLVLCSDGLSDPFPEDEGKNINGFEHEFYVQTNSLLEVVNQSWQMDMLIQMSQLAAANGGIREQLDKYHYMTVELVVKYIPSHFINKEGRIGVILGVPSKIIPDMIKLPLSDTKLVSVILLTLKELDFVTEKGSGGRIQLAEKFIDSTGSITSLERVSLV